MTCPYQKALYAWPHGPHDTETLKQHVASCPSCAQTVARIEGVRTALRVDVSPMSAQARAALWASLDTKPAEPVRSWRPVFAGSVLAAACAAGLMFFLASKEAVSPVPPPKVTIDGPVLVAGHAKWAERTAGVGDAVAMGTRVALSAGSRVDLGPARLQVEAPSLLRLDSKTRLLVHEFHEGQVTFEVDPIQTEAPATVVTTHARIQVLGTRFTVAVDPQATRVMVHSGRVEVTPNEGEGVVLHKGDHWTSERPHPSPRAQAEVSLRRSKKGTPKKPDANGPGLDPETLLTRADTARRQKRHAAAAADYGRVAEHPDGGPYAEEAWFRRAQMLMTLSDYAGAQAALAAAERRFPSGTLRPERLALLAKLSLLRADVPGARSILESAQPGSSSWLLQKTRIEVAEKWAETAPEAAMAWLDRVLSETTAADVRAEALDLRRRLEKKIQDR